jgi:hypothetical protein
MVDQYRSSRCHCGAAGDGDARHQRRRNDDAAAIRRLLPVWISAVLTPRDFTFALGGFRLLTVWKMPPWIVVVLLAGVGVLSRVD